MKTTTRRILLCALAPLALLSIAATDYENIQGGREPGTVVVVDSEGDLSVIGPGGKQFLVIPHLPRRIVPGWIATHFKPPVKPDEVAVQLETEDGRHWVAVWVPDPRKK